MKKIEKFIKRQFEITSYSEIKFTLLIVLIVGAIGIYFGRATFSDFILLLTFGALLWYSFETKKLKNATNIANAIQAEPLLVLQFKNKHLYIVNYGKGPAFNIEMKIKNIQGFFNFSLPNPNPMHYEDEKILIQDNEGNNQNIEAEVVLQFFKSEGDEVILRERRYKIQKVADGWFINFLG